MILPHAPDTYNRADQDELRHALEHAMMRLEARVTTPHISGDRGDASITLTAADLPIQRFATALTANRTVTLAAGGAGTGFTIVRTGLGAFTLDVGPGLQTIPANTAAFVDVGNSGAGWILLRYAPLTTAAAAHGVRVTMTAQSVPTATETTLLFTTEDYDTDAFHDTGTNTGRLTVPTGLAGKYVVLASALNTTGNATGDRYALLRKNGVTSYIQDHQNTYPAALGLTNHAILSLVATDYVELRVWQNSGVANNYDAEFQMCFLGT